MFARLVVVVVGVGVCASGCASARSSPLHPDVYAGQLGQRSGTAKNGQELVASNGRPEDEQRTRDDESGRTITMQALGDDQSDGASTTRRVGEVVLFVAAAGLLLIVLLWK
jgi:hypothetical protein